MTTKDVLFNEFELEMYALETKRLMKLTKRIDPTGIQIPQR